MMFENEVVTVRYRDTWGLIFFSLVFRWFHLLLGTVPCLHYFFCMFLFRICQRYKHWMPLAGLGREASFWVFFSLFIDVRITVYLYLGIFYSFWNVVSPIIAGLQAVSVDMS